MSSLDSQGLGQPYPPNYNKQSPRRLARVSLLFPGWIQKVSKFQGIPNKQFRFFLFYDVHKRVIRFLS